MMREIRVIFVYVFDLLESYTTQDYVKIAAKEYVKSEKDILSHRNSFSEDLFEINRTPSGKPYFRNCEGIGFSVSHSEKYMICALTNGNVGVDIELKRKLSDESVEMFADRLCRIADRFFHPDEAAFIKADPITRFYEVFTAKESFVKFTGTGFDETLGETSLLSEYGSIPSCHMRSDFVHWHSGEVEFWQTQYNNDYTLSICTEFSNIPCEIQVIYLGDPDLL